MIFDALGLPREYGASDLQDSARLAGIMTVFGHPEKVNCARYVIPDEKREYKYVRHPNEVKYDFSRDQAICLMAGLFTSGYQHLVNRKYVDGKDWFSPSHNGHVRTCRGLKPRWYQKLWLWFDVLWSCYISPKDEANQLLCMLMVTDKKYLRFWLEHNPYWVSAIYTYWNGWRGESILAGRIVKKLKEVSNYG